MVAAAILDFQKFEILTVDQRQWSSVRHYFKSHQNRQTIAELRRFNSFFSKWRPCAILVYWAPIGTTHDDHLMVSIVVQNVVEIGAGISIT